MFIEPMYANPLPNLVKNPKAKPFILDRGLWVAEEKYDGLRIVTEISDTSDRLFVKKGVTSWSRYGNLKPLPDHIQEELAELPNCFLDGEAAVPGKRSYGTMDLDNADEMRYFVFDILQIHRADTTPLPWYQRQQFLKDLFHGRKFKSVELAKATDVDTWDDIYTLRDEMWGQDREGLIVKRKDAVYTIGKRPKNTWIKIKKLQSALFTIIGFTPSRGQINDRGPYGMVQLRDEDGNVTQVKTKNDAQCRLFEQRASIVPHPDLGRKLWCEYQERTPDNSYRHIRWERWDE